MPCWIWNLPYRSWALNFQISFPSRSKQAKSPVPLKTKTYLPSVLGDGEAWLASSRRNRALPLLNFCFHNCLPSVLMHKSTRSSPSSLVKNSRSPQIAGVAPLMPGNASFQTMFLVALHSAGMLVSAQMPSLFGPRHCGQFSPRAAATHVTNPHNASNQQHFTVTSLVGRVSKPAWDQSWWGRFPNLPRNLPNCQPAPLFTKNCWPPPVIA